MRFCHLLLIATLPAAGGCSGLIARSGRDVRKLETREQVHRRFGAPKSVAIDEGGQLTETYHTRRKIADTTMRTETMGMAFVMTYGLGEFIMFPRELFILARRTARGQELRFTYGDSGRLLGVTLDGDPLDPLRQRIPVRKEAEPQPNDAQARPAGASAAGPS